ncbi:MAG: ATP-binding protein [bacterium]|nr:ATP-binding protein [bacterium]
MQAHAEERLSGIISDIKQLRAEIKITSSDAVSDAHIKTLTQLLKNLDRLLSGIDDASQEIRDLRVIFGATLEHNTEVENELTYERDRVAGVSRRYEFIVNSSGDYMALINQDMLVEEVNKAFCQYIGKTRSQIIGQVLQDLLRSGGVQSSLDEPIAQCFKGHVQNFSLELGKAADRQYFDCQIYPFFDTTQSISHVVLVMRDITERVTLEHQVIRSQRMESIGTLAGGIAHDLNNILSPFFMALRTLAPKVKGDADAMKILGILESSAARGSELVKQILTFSRGVEGEKVQMQLKYLVHELDGFIRETFPKGVEVCTDVERDLWAILGDTTQIHQILLNLCVNARDAIDKTGTIELSVRNEMVANRSFMGRKLKDGPYICITVKDDGQGISSEIADKIFEPFFTTKEFGKGTGIGLSTVMAVVRNHNGYIEFDTDINKGTTFRVYLPAIESKSRLIRNDKPDDEIPSGDGELVLIIDDEKSLRDITKSTLENYGYKVLTAVNGKTGLSQFATHQKRIDVVIVDMMMPVMDGQEVIRKIRELSNVPIVGVTGMILPEFGKQIELERDMVNGFLFKPYTGELLLTTLSEVLKETRTT